MDELLQEKMLGTIRSFKELRDGVRSRLPVFLLARKAGWLVPVVFEDAKRTETLTRLTQWHRRNIVGGPSLAASAVVGPGRWLTENVMAAADHLLFWVQDLEGNPIGHAGVSGIQGASAEIGYLLRGEQSALPGAMYGATQALIGWCFQQLGAKELVLRIFPSNRPALCLAERCGFADAAEALAVRSDDEAGDMPRLTMGRGEWMRAHRLARAA